MSTIVTTGTESCRIAHTCAWFGSVLRTIGGNAIRAGDIIRSLREMTVRGDCQIVPIDVGEVVDEALTLALVGAREMGIES